MPLVLLNKSPNDILLSLELRKSAKATTFRRNSSVPTFVKIPARRTLNVEAALCMNKASALEILERSPEVQSRLAARTLVLLDEEAVRAESAPALKLAVAAKAERDANRDVAAEEAAKEELKRQTRIQHRPQEQKGHNGLEAKTDAEALVAAVVGTSDGLDANVRAAISDNTPSTKWTTERLIEYAKQHGIKADGLSKNAVLREIRKRKV